MSRSDRGGPINARILQRLGGPDGLGEGVRAVRRGFPCHVHEKIYFFSHPEPTVYAGSFNPSQNRHDDAALLADIGTQGRGHNFLVEIVDPVAVAFLKAHLLALHNRRLCGGISPGCRCGRNGTNQSVAVTAAY